MSAFAKNEDAIAQTARFARRYIFLRFEFEEEGLMSRLGHVKVGPQNGANDVLTFLVTSSMLKISFNKLELTMF
jgi:hypothetical protein